MTEHLKPAPNGPAGPREKAMAMRSPDADTGERATQEVTASALVASKDEIHVLRNPHGFAEDVQRAARLWGADEIERLSKELKDHMWWERTAVELQRQRDALQADAARYQFLRSMGYRHCDVGLSSDIDGDDTVHLKMTFAVKEPKGMAWDDAEDGWSVEDFDKAIDNAIACSGPETTERQLCTKCGGHQTSTDSGDTPCGHCAGTGFETEPKHRFTAEAKEGYCIHCSRVMGEHSKGNLYCPETARSPLFCECGCVAPAPGTPCAGCGALYTPK